jgi:hypothetical protein
LEGCDLGEADAVILIAAGAPARAALRPHTGTVRGKPYALLLEEGATDLGLPISVIAGAAGLSGRSASTAADKVWCLAGQTVMTRDRQIPGPSLPCSWCRLKLGWLVPYEAAAGRLALAPLGASNHAVRIPVREGEYYLLENRSRWGFDRALPREGLVIWHVTPPDARCTTCLEGGIIDVWTVHDPARGAAPQAARYEPFQSLPKKGLTVRLADGRTEITGIKTDARSNIYFEIARTEPR